MPDWQEVAVVAAKALVIYLSALTMVRLGKSRFLGKNTAFDVILGIMVGSVLGRPINGDAPVVASLVAGAVLIGTHYVLSWLALHSDVVGLLTKGRSDQIVTDGTLDRRRLNKHLMTQRDLEENLRLHGTSPHVAAIGDAYFERNGQISVLPKRDKGKPEVTTVSVRDGVQTVRIEWHR